VYARRMGSSLWMMNSLVFSYCRGVPQGRTVYARRMGSQSVDDELARLSYCGGRYTEAHRKERQKGQTVIHSSKVGGCEGTPSIPKEKHRPRYHPRSR